MRKTLRCSRRRRRCWKKGRCCCCCCAVPAGNPREASDAGRRDGNHLRHCEREGHPTGEGQGETGRDGSRRRGTEDCRSASASGHGCLGGEASGVIRSDAVRWIGIARSSDCWYGDLHLLAIAIEQGQRTTPHHPGQLMEEVTTPALAPKSEKVEAAKAAKEQRGRRSSLLCRHGRRPPRQWRERQQSDAL